MKIRNKIISLFASTAIIACAAATNVLAQAKNFAGPSLAINGAYTGTNTDVTYGTTTLSLGQNDFVYGGDLSYSFPVDNNFFIALGATYDFSKTKAGHIGAGASAINLSLDEHYSFYVQPSYALNNTSAVFAKLGYHNAEGIISVSYDSQTASGTKDFSGWGYGFGVKTFINSNVFIQAEASLVKYDKETEDGVGFEPEVALGIISIGYKF
jgi:opacity protein-like surface antigen